MRIIVPSGIWYDRNLELEFPDRWDIQVVEPSFKPPALSDYELRAAMQVPIGSPTISGLAKGRKNAVIIVDDTTRPTPAHRILPFILEELNASGIEDDDILIVIGIGTHRQMNRTDMVMKLGAEIVSRIHVINHDLDGPHAYLGETSHGTPIYIDEEVMTRELKLAVGCVIPHGGAAFSGGAKAILPGVAGLETIRHNHTTGLRGGGRGVNPDNELRLDMEEMAKKVGLDAIVNVMINGNREITGLFVGDFVLAHRQAAEFSRKCCEIEIVSQPDIVVSNAYPEDLNLRYAWCGSWVLNSVKEGGTKILIAGCPEGTGYHRLYGRPITPTLKHFKESGEIQSTSKLEKSKSDFIAFSPFIGPKETYEILPNCLFFNSWTELMKEVMPKYQDKQGVKVAVYPYAGIQIPRGRK